jgi:U3 small nucleolar RNA-associated protein 20
VPPPAWSPALLTQPLEWWLGALDDSALSQLPLRLRLGFLNTFEDLLGHLGHQLQPLLAPLLAITMHMLTSACAGLTGGQTDPGSESQPAEAAAAAGAGGALSDTKEASREVRATSLKILAQVWTRFPAATDFNPLWPHFFAATAPLLARLQPEAAAPAPPPLLQCVVALAAAPGLVRVLGNLPSHQEAPSDDQEDQGEGPSPMQVVPPAAAAAVVDDGQTTVDWPAGEVPAWAAAGAGGKLLSSCITMLTLKGCSDATRDAVLRLLETLLGLSDPGLLRTVLLPWSGVLLQALRVSVNEQLAAAATAGRGVRGMKVRGAAAAQMTSARV